MLNDFDEINLMLDQMFEESISECAIEPIDDPNCEIDYWDWAEILGIVDELEPEEYNA